MALIGSRREGSRSPADSGRALPDFIIIGAQKCGTSSLYAYLSENPYVRAASKKEVHYFDWNFRRGIEWYRSHFPTLEELGRCSQTGSHFLTGEASPYYLFDPRVPKRVKNQLPQVRLIVLLRNPVYRALSHFHDEARRGVEPLTFAEALDREGSRLRAARAFGRGLGRRHGYYETKAYIHYSYLARGLYAVQLQRWYRLFPAEQILVIKAEDMYADPQTTLHEVASFLGIPVFVPRKFEAVNACSYLAMDPTLCRRLHRYFSSHNARLYRMIGKYFGWEEALCEARTS